MYYFFYNILNELIWTKIYLSSVQTIRIALRHLKFSAKNWPYHKIMRNFVHRIVTLEQWTCIQFAIQHPHWYSKSYVILGYVINIHHYMKTASLSEILIVSQTNGKQGMLVDKCHFKKRRLKSWLVIYKSQFLYKLLRKKKLWSNSSNDFGMVKTIIPGQPRAMSKTVMKNKCRVRIYLIF